jgi:hypothetical protein
LNELPNFPAMGAILYLRPVEKKRFSHIPCGISRFGTLKYSKIAVFPVRASGNGPTVQVRKRCPSGSRRHVIMLVRRQILRSGLLAASSAGEASVSCAICEKRKQKRFCPALHARICPQCCGEQREVRLDCPSDCVYLRQARLHEKPRAPEDLDPSALFSQVEIGEQFLNEHEHLLLGLSFVLAQSAKADRNLTDSDLIAALTSAAKTFETLTNSGLHYETPSPHLGQQAIAASLHKTVLEYREAEQKHTGQTRLRDRDVLRALVFLVRMAHARTSGRPKARAFVDFLLAQFPENPSALAGEEGASRLIVP